MSDISTSSSEIDDTMSPAPMPIAEGVGLSNPQVSKSRRAMLDLVNRLHSTGVQIDIDLPQIAVIGSQSAGKSSLIESISGITLPRAAGTCTRCPTECQLARSKGPWRCVVSLRFIKDSRGQTLGHARKEVFGPPIFNKSEVEERIRRAQRAILNPNQPAKKYLEGDDEDSATEVSFSTNCVSLEISGPDVADLSFCDLPGLIASVSKGGNEGDIELVKSLVTSYIQKPSCLILLTVACETDFENQGAHHLAKYHDPAGKRTIGVLTKPDRIPQGEEASWIPYIRNEKEALENNWYCVKQPNSNELKQGITWTQARTKEDEFFSMTAPWCNLDPMYQKYLRTSNLVDRLSSILSDLISKRLPKIQEELENAIHSAQHALNLLPKEPSKQPMNEIATLLHVFTTDLGKHVEGIPDEAGLLQGIQPAQEKFRRAIRSTAPKFVPYEKRYAGRKSAPKPAFLSNEEEVESLSDSDDEIQSQRPVETPPPSKKIRLADSIEAPSPATAAMPRKGDTIHIDEVFKRAQRARTRELPGNYPFVVQQTYISNFLEMWRAPSQILCKSVHAYLNGYVHKLVEKHFADFGQGNLQQRVRVIIQDHIRECMARVEERIEWLLCLEDRPFSLNTHYFSDYKEKFLAHYKGAREADKNQTLTKAIKDYRSPSPTRPSSFGSQESPITKVLSGLVEMGILDVKPEELAKLLPADEMGPALNVMADVRAYFQVAYKRFADNVPLAIDYELVRGTERGVLAALYEGLGINGPEGHRICQDLAQESPQIADRREELMKKLERLRVASHELLHIGF